ncbi:MAG: DNA sulfur modification protein DndB [Candidatus Dormibacteria bacterium]
MNHPTSPGLTLPAIRGKQGGRWMYSVQATLEIVNELISPDVEPIPERSQRQLDPARARAISSYMTLNKGSYVLGAMTYGADREAHWFPSEFDPNVGLLHLPLGTKLRSVDGQHRRHGIKTAMEEDSSLGSDSMAMLIYVEPKVERRRQMFSDMNWTAKPVSKSVNVNFDERDPFARNTVWLVENSYFFLDPSTLDQLIERERPSVRVTSEKLYTIGNVYDALTWYVLGPERKATSRNTPDDPTIKDKAEHFIHFLDTRHEFKELRNNPKAIPALRRVSVLVNGTTLKVLASAAWQLEQDGLNLADTQIAERLSSVDFTPSGQLWQLSGFVAAGSSSPISRLGEVRRASAMLAHFLRTGEDPVAPLAEAGAAA